MGGETCPTLHSEPATTATATRMVPMVTTAGTDMDTHMVLLHILVTVMGTLVPTGLLVPTVPLLVPTVPLLVPTVDMVLVPMVPMAVHTADTAMDTHMVLLLLMVATTVLLATHMVDMVDMAVMATDTHTRCPTTSEANRHQIAESEHLLSIVHCKMYDI